MDQLGELKWGHPCYVGKCFDYLTKMCSIKISLQINRFLFQELKEANEPVPQGSIIGKYIV